MWELCEFSGEDLSRVNLNFICNSNSDFLFKSSISKKSVRIENNLIVKADSKIQIAQVRIPSKNFCLFSLCNFFISQVNSFLWKIHEKYRLVRKNNHPFLNLTLFEQLIEKLSLVWRKKIWKIVGSNPDRK